MPKIIRKDIKVPEESEGKKEFPILASGDKLTIGITVTMRGKRCLIVREMTPQEVREQCLVLFQLMDGVSVYWYEVKVLGLKRTGSGKSV